MKFWRKQILNKYINQYMLMVFRCSVTISALL